MKSIPNSGDHVPDDVFLWDDFLESVNLYEFTDEKRYQRPQFSCSRSGVGAQAIFEFNICEVLNELLPDYEFSRKNTKKPGDPDFTCFFAQSTLLFPIEIKPEYLLEVRKLQFPEFYKKSAEARAVIKQIFSYMTENECQYGVLSTYNKHCDDSYYSHALKIPESVTRKDDGSVSKHTRSLRPRTKSSSDNSSGSSSSSILYKGQKNNQNLSFIDFKFNGILGQGRSGKTLKCEFRGNTIALK
ncbi:unnamed protein product [Rhizophagus irregularis]|nr:unnamed protein product [Rhizophagus irregularis]